MSQIPIDETGEEPDVCVIELGGTVGDIESAPFIEAMRTLRRRAGKDNFLQIHVSLIPVTSGEQKTKPTQQAIRDVRSLGLSPDLIACRCVQQLSSDTVQKVAHYCQVELDQVLAVRDVKSTYHVPLLLEEQGLLRSLTSILHLSELNVAPEFIARGQHTWKEWKSLTWAQDRLVDSVCIALVGKYTNLHDSYISLIKSLEHAAMRCRRKLELIWVDAEHLEEPAQSSRLAQYHKAWGDVCTAQGIIVPGGFGLRGTEGMIKAATWARTNGTPYLGICLGMQLAVVEYAREVCKLKDASSKEFREDRGFHKDDLVPHEVIVPMEEIDQEVMGGTMRLGLQATVFQPGSEISILRQLYQNSPQAAQTEVDPQATSPAQATAEAMSTPKMVNGSNSPLPSRILERHRHRYEVNPTYVSQLTSDGLQFTGRDVAGKRMEICELPRDKHPFYVGVQFHPEYLSRVLEPSRPYLGFIAASAMMLDSVIEAVTQGHGRIDADGMAEEMPRRRTLEGADLPKIGCPRYTRNQDETVNGEI